MNPKAELNRALALLAASNALSSPKLLLRVIFHIYSAVGIVLQKKFKGEFAEQLLALQLQNSEDAKFIKELHLILAHHKESPVEFIRNDALVICSPDYDIEKISLEKVQCYLDKAKIFIDKTTT